MYVWIITCIVHHSAQKKELEKEKERKKTYMYTNTRVHHNTIPPTHNSLNGLD